MTSVSTTSNCRGKHGLKEFMTPSGGYQCDGCQEMMSKNDKMFGCRTCNFDLCTDCMIIPSSNANSNVSTSNPVSNPAPNPAPNPALNPASNPASNPVSNFFGNLFGNNNNNDQKNDNNNDNDIKENVKFQVNNNGSVTFYPTTNITPGNKKFNTSLFSKTGKCPNNVEGLFDYNKKLVNDYSVNQSTNNSFINACELAYAKHYPLLIKPEHIFLLIIQAISIHVDKYSEKLRSKYVNHLNGKKILTVRVNSNNWVRRSPNNDWNGAITSFVEQIDKNTKKDIVPLFNADFSSTTLVEQIAAKITLMSTCKNYFDYRMVACICGFTEITLGGNINDWIKLKEKVRKLLTNKVDPNFGKKWKISLLPILDRFINAFLGDISMVFWNSMIYRGQWTYFKGSGAYGMGGKQVKHYKKFLSGWINILFPYIGSKDYENRFAFEPYSDDNSAQKQYKGYKYDHHKNNQLTSKLGPEPNDFPEGIVEAPVKFDDDYKNVHLNLKFKAGFVGFEQNQNTLKLSPTVGWYIT